MEASVWGKHTKQVLSRAVKVTLMGGSEMLFFPDTWEATVFEI